ncbi:MAG TPA: BON domain-containing protein [Rhodopila sp.]|nr:BON domain-containing protein [Rhodopila sp.]
MDDTALRHAVTEELEWAPHVDASRIQVAVHDGIVHLSGYVSSLTEKKAASRTIWHLEGVTGVRDEIVVQPAEGHRHADEELSRRARQVLDWDAVIPARQIEVASEGGVVTLSGTVNDAYQRAEAEQRVQHLAGVVHVENRIAIRPRPEVAAEVGNNVRRALARHSEIDSSRIIVDVHGSKVTLSGHVPTYTQRRIAENAAWAAPGVDEVLDALKVSP